MSMFVLFFLIITILTEESGANKLLGTRIKKGQFPWLVQFKTVIPCGGILVSSDWILTAAQCVQGDRQSILLEAVGLNETESLQVVNVMHAYIFPKFNTQDPNNNIALVKLMRPFNLCDAEFPFLDLGPPRNHDENFKSCFIFGWESYVGLQSKKVFAKPIQYSEIIVNSWKNCAYMYKGNASFLNVFCTMVDTAGERLACAGNPGTPVVCQEQNDKMLLLGIASWTKFSFDCGGSPTYLNTHLFRGWVNEILKNNRENSLSRLELCPKKLNEKKEFPESTELRNQFSADDVEKILNEAKKLNIFNVKKKFSLDNLDERKKENYSFSNENYRNSQDDDKLFLKHQETDLNKKLEVNEVTKNTNLDDSDELLPFTIDDESHSFSSDCCTFVNIFPFRYKLIILSLFFLYCVYCVNYL